jgi:hypothetical protein
LEVDEAIAKGARVGDGGGGRTADAAGGGWAEPDAGCGQLAAGGSRVQRSRATSRGARSLRSTDRHMDLMDSMDGMDPEGESLHLWRKA